MTPAIGFQWKQSCVWRSLKLWDIGKCDRNVTCLHYLVTYFHESARAMSPGQHGTNSQTSAYTLQLLGDSTLTLYASSVLVVLLLSCAF